VLFTRARYRCEVFCSFDPADIDTNRATGEGVKVLKRYLAYAETGVLDQPASTERDYESPFEKDVARVIVSLGFLADPQLGTAGFKIDLGVRDPEHSWRYILAVECDGAAYHGALWARERDRLRQEILESQGWRFHRIWSTDWFYRRSDEIKRLNAVLEGVRGEADRPRRPIA
jgi:REase_MTES_1575